MEEWPAYRAVTHAVSAADWQAPVAETAEKAGQAGFLGVILIIQVSSLHDQPEIIPKTSQLKSPGKGRANKEGKFKF